jgi:hypothetical protein
MILIELTAAVDAAGTLTTFYVSEGGFVTGPSDTPAHTAFLPVVLDPGSIGIHAYGDGRTGGATRLEIGEIVLANADGALDEWVNYSFDGRPVTIRSGVSGAYPSSFPAVLVATADGIEADMSQIVIRLRDKQYLFEKPVLAARYAGNNALPAGLEGTASDIKGRAKPKAYGKVMNASPPCVNTSRLEFEVGICNSVDAVYDRGATMTAGAAYASQSDMETTAPTASNFRAWAAGGYFRLGSSPVGQITADITQGAAAGNRTVAQILKRLALDAGLASGEISIGDVTALDAANSNVVGIWLDNESVTFKTAMDEVAASIGAYYGLDAAGVLRMGRLATPSGPPVVTLYDYDIGNRIERRPPRDNGIPVWRVTVKHTRVWTPQPTDLAGSVAAATRAYLAEEWRSETAEDASIKTQWLLAGEMTVETLLTSSADAAAEAVRLLALYKVRRDIFEVTVPIDIVTDNSLKFMDVVELQLDRFGMDAGKSFRLIGMAPLLARAQVTLTLWG